MNEIKQKGGASSFFSIFPWDPDPLFFVISINPSLPPSISLTPTTLKLKPAGDGQRSATAMVATSQISLAVVVVAFVYSQT